MADSVERSFVVTKTPIFYGVERERLVKGEPKLTQPFVELWLQYRVAGLEAVRVWRPEVHLGLRESESATEYRGYNDFTQPDPIRLFRALQILDRFDTVDDPYLDLRDTYAVTRASGILRFDRYVRHRVAGIIGKSVFKDISQTVPSHLAEVIENFKREKLPIDGSTLEKEIRRGRVQSQPLYERVIQETKRREARMGRAWERYEVAKYASL